MSDFTGKTLTDKGLKHYTRRLTASYFLAMALVGILALSLFGVLFAQINSQGRYATMIGASGRQRALAQRVALFCLRLARNPTRSGGRDSGGSRRAPSAIWNASSAG